MSGSGNLKTVGIIQIVSQLPAIMQVANLSLKLAGPFREAILSTYALPLLSRNRGVKWDLEVHYNYIFGHVRYKAFKQEEGCIATGKLSPPPYPLA